MKLLLYLWNANNEEVLADNLRKQGFEVVCFRKECRHYTRDMELAMEMIQEIHAQKVQGVISFNYFPIISMICNTCQIPYYAWVYDCPHFTLYAKQVTLPCNRIGIFDKEMVEHLRRYGVNTVYHVPLSVDVHFFSEIIDKATVRMKQRYSCDISFVGSLYTDEHNYYDLLFDGEEETDKTDAMIPEQRELDGLIDRQCFSYQEDYLQEAIEKQVNDLKQIQERMEMQGLMLGEDYFALSEDILKAAVLEKKVTVEERRRLLQQIAEAGNEDGKGQGRQSFHFKFYTGSDTASFPLLHKYNCGRVDYKTQMPLVFAGSKINLNISLRSIHSGIPLRVLDIMACGGFVLTNWQPEITEFFVDGQELAMFHSMEECMEKIQYYLTHEEERKQIAKAGREKVRTQFCYKKGLAQLMISE